MAKAVADPDELRQFAAALKKFTDGLAEGMTSLNGRMNALGQTWRDQEHDKFLIEYQDTMRALARFKQTAEDHIPFLLRKADRIDEYLRQR